jgi:hypothetical protein
MTKLVVVSSSAMILVLAVPAVVSAQSALPPGACPPGSWFCAPAAQQAVPAEQRVLLQSLPDPDAPAPLPPGDPRPPLTNAAAPLEPPVVVYQPPPPVSVVRLAAPSPYEYSAPSREPISRGREWGLNLRVEGASIGSGYQHNAGMAGGGGGLRYKPNAYFGLETDLDFVGGRGYVGDLRRETALTFNGLFFLNPESAAQVYLLAGFGWSWANGPNEPNDSSDPSVTQSSNYSYSYFGGQAGVGLELRLTRALALDVDMRGFVRTRTDQLASSQPEFTNSQGQTTNTSGGGLLTAGITLYAQ